VNLAIWFPASAKLIALPLPEIYVLHYITLFKLILLMPAIGRIYGKTHGADVAKNRPIVLYFIKNTATTGAQNGWEMPVHVELRIDNALCARRIVSIIFTLLCVIDRLGGGPTGRKQDTCD
jgi:hypothetical protein